MQYNKIIFTKKNGTWQLVQDYVLEFLRIYKNFQANHTKKSDVKGI